jgi:hypothetical protein
MSESKSGMRRDQRVLLVLAAIFFVPLFVAWLWYANVESFRPTESIAKGDLVEPVRTLGSYELAAAGSGPGVTDESLHGRWALIYIGGPVCGEDCRQSLYEMRQVHIALGRDAERAQRVYVIVGAASPDDPAYLAEQHPDLSIVQVAADDPWLAHFRLDGRPVAEAGRIYVVDPLGNLMMRYEASAVGRDLLDDLKRLFRVSRIG